MEGAHAVLPALVAQETDVDDVRWALHTAQARWQAGGHADALDVIRSPDAQAQRPGMRGRARGPVPGGTFAGLESQAPDDPQRFMLRIEALEMIDALGPGGWTIIVPAQPGWSSPALAGGTTVGVY